MYMFSRSDVAKWLESDTINSTVASSIHEYINKIVSDTDNSDSYEDLLDKLSDNEFAEVVRRSMASGYKPSGDTTNFKTGSLVSGDTTPSQTKSGNKGLVSNDTGSDFMMSESLSKKVLNKVIESMGASGVGMDGGGFGDDDMSEAKNIDTMIDELGQYVESTKNGAVELFETILAAAESHSIDPHDSDDVFELLNKIPESTVTDIYKEFISSKESLSKRFLNKISESFDIRPGEFHKWLGKPESEPITQEDIDKAMAYTGKYADHVHRMAGFAKASKEWHHE